MAVKETSEARTARMQEAFNRASTSAKLPLAQTNSYRTGTIFDYTRPEFPSMLTPEAREKLWGAEINVSPENRRAMYNVFRDTINISPNVKPIKAEHEAIHALAIGGGNAIQRGFRNVDPLFWGDLTPDQQKAIEQRYPHGGIVEAFRWRSGRGQEAPAVLWESVKGNPRAVSLYTAAVPFFQKYFRAEYFE